MESHLLISLAGIMEDKATLSLCISTASFNPLNLATEIESRGQVGVQQKSALLPFVFPEVRSGSEIDEAIEIGLLSFLW